METLEKRIEEILNQSWKGEYGNSEFDEKESSKVIASEVKDIAIAFAKYRSETIAHIPFNDYLPTDDEIWSDFLTTHYSKKH